MNVFGVLPDNPLASLSERERVVFDHFGRGTPPQKIAAELSLSVKTVSTYRARFMEKLRLKNNAEVAVLAWRVTYESGPDAGDLLSLVMLGAGFKWDPAQRLSADYARWTHPNGTTALRQPYMTEAQWYQHCLAKIAEAMNVVAA